jgi:AcrR family transcriptional regulator
MASPSRAFDVESRKARAERVMDAAAELLLRWGYKRVTIEDVAARAAIGKGTIYLHWTTREALFCAVLQRELAGAIEQLVAAVRDDHSLATFDRLMPLWFATVKCRPLVRACILVDLDVLGKLTKDVHGAIQAWLADAFQEYLKGQMEHGLIGNDLPPEDLIYALRVTLHGFFMADVFFPQESLSVEHRAELLGHVLRQAFRAPVPPPSGAAEAVAPRAIDIFSRLADNLREQLRKAYE